MAAPLALLALAGLAHAQVPTDAGHLQRQLEQTLTPPAATAPTPAAPAAPEDRSGPSVVVRRVVIEGATLIPAEELARQLDASLDRPQTLGELHAAAQALVGYYRTRGWFVRVLLPQQDVTGGTLRIQVVEGRFGSLLMAPGQTRARQDFVARIVGRRLDAGQPYSQADLERGLLLANDLPGIAADGVLQAGAAPGSTDLALSVRDGPWVSGQLGLGNLGSRTTGALQGYGMVALNNPSGYGDQLSLSAAAAGHLDYQTLGYGVPLGHDGLRLSLGYSQLHYRLGKEFEALDASGQARTATAGLAYPLLRGAERNLWLALNLGQRRNRDDSLGFTLRERRLNTLGLSLYGDSRDAFGRGGQTAWRAELTQGNAALRLADDRRQDAAGPRVAGGFTRLNADLRRDQVLGAASYLRVRAAGQWSADNLDSSQQFGLGGPYGVRGYPASEGYGDSGALAQLELHALLAPALFGLNAGLDAYLFADAGVVRQHRARWPGWDMQGTNRNTYALYATGLGLRWSLPRGFALDAVFAVPLGHNPASANPGRNQDGSRRGARLWISASLAF